MNLVGLFSSLTVLTVLLLSIRQPIDPAGDGEGQRERGNCNKQYGYFHCLCPD